MANPHGTIDKSDPARWVKTYRSGDITTVKQAQIKTNLFWRSEKILWEDNSIDYKRENRKYILFGPWVAVEIYHSYTSENRGLQGYEDEWHD